MALHSTQPPHLCIAQGRRERRLCHYKIVLPDGRCKIFSQVREADGTPAWQSWSQDKSPVEEGHADDYVGRRLKIDPDLWVWR